MKSRQAAIVNATTMCRTAAIIDSGMHDPSSFPAEDYDLFIRLSKIGKLENLPEVLLDVRIHKKSIISNSFKESLEKYTHSIEKHFGRRINRLRHLYLLIDAKSAILYRKGLYTYLNRTKILGIGLIILAITINPLRMVFFIQKKLKS